MRKFYPSAKRGTSGQESAPFELLVAVILMAFVLFAGYNALDRLNKQVCQNVIESELNEFSRSLENTATGKGSNEFTFNFSQNGTSCSAKINDCAAFGSTNPGDVQCVQLVDSTDPKICSAHCPSARTLCSLLIYKSAKYSSVIKCVDISTTTVFPEAGSPQCPDRASEGWILRGVGGGDNSVLPGTYSLLKSNDLTAKQPIVCMYLNVGTGGAASP